MREIKFRGKRVNNGKWVYGVPLYSVVGAKVIIDTIQSYEDLRYYTVIPETVGQFTGLHDKNGKEIYEGDIVEYKDFSNGMYLFKEQPKARGVIKIDNLLNGIYLKGMGTFEGNKAEIIDNIHTNPELLKEVSDEA